MEDPAAVPRLCLAGFADSLRAFVAALRADHLAESSSDTGARPGLAEVAYRLAFVVENIFRKSRLSVFAFEDCGRAAAFDDVLQIALKRDGFRLPRLGIFRA